MALQQHLCYCRSRAEVPIDLKDRTLTRRMRVKQVRAPPSAIFAFNAPGRPALKSATMT